MVLVLEVEAEEVAAEAEALAVGVAGTHQSPFIAMCNGITSFISSMYVINTWGRRRNKHNSFKILMRLHHLQGKVDLKVEISNSSQLIPRYRSWMERFLRCAHLTLSHSSPLSKV